jgi:predicted 3-demethylubiquinone-9 3-methyltransferase (glyoxalase superfamily)
VVNCDTQEEVDYFWNQLTAGGDSNAQQCGWLKDKFGLSWQVVPTELEELLTDPDQSKVEHAFEAMLKMKKLDINELEAATHSA